jgi:hypothetical protein
MRGLAASVLLAACSAACVAGVLGPAALREQQNAVQKQLDQTPYDRPLVLQSREASRRAEGDVYAVLAHPFPAVKAALSDPDQWCDILILHLNTKYCRSGQVGGAPRIEVRVGKKKEESIKAASLLSFEWRLAERAADYFGLEMGAPDGPMDTSDYRMVVEAVPIDSGRTFLHMGYAFSFGGTGHLAMHAYLATVARNKVGFTSRVGDASAAYVGGVRGVVERNTMRYYLAIESYLRSLEQPPHQQLEYRLAAWFDATEKFSRQLHELERDEYLRMKRNEIRRQNEFR